MLRIEVGLKSIIYQNCGRERVLVEFVIEFSREIIVAIRTFDRAERVELRQQQHLNRESIVNLSRNDYTLLNVDVMFIKLSDFR